MVKKSSPVDKAARMLDLVPFITAHQGISTADLASQFGVSEEELLSDLNSLWMCGDNRFDLIDLLGTYSQLPTYCGKLAEFY